LTLISETLTDLRQRLTQVSQSPDLDSQVLLAHVLDKSRAWILAHPENSLTNEEILALEAAATRLETGTPLPYVLGQWEFFGLKFRITPETLIPRPETELLVENALTWLNQHPRCRLALDVGTGSGCIAIALASRIPDLKIIATDKSFSALDVARVNALQLGTLQQVEFLQANLMPPVKSKFNLICANLPYIPTSTLHTLKVYGKEPELALDGGKDGLDLIRSLIYLAAYSVSPGGLILLEIESSQGGIGSSLAKTVFPDAHIRILPDLAGLDRLLRIQIAE
jgi:release factor glutamine methyltransferase